MQANQGMSLGAKTGYMSKYSPQLLFPIQRDLKRKEILIETPLPFYGVDFWTAYEISWLDKLGKPNIAVGHFIFPCESKSLIESKSLKLYLNSFNQTVFESRSEVESIIRQDLSLSVERAVEVDLLQIGYIKDETLSVMQGICLDDIPIKVIKYDVFPECLSTSNDVVTETLYSNLLKSNCLVTNQPDWGSVQIQYSGNKIDRENLLRYIVSFREHNEFHEQCVEKIFKDIMTHCAPSALSVYAKYTRRGGLDISPFRSTGRELPFHSRDVRQ